MAHAPASLAIRMELPRPAFDALVAAYEPGPGGLRGLVPVAGRALVEHQLRRARAAGAERLLLLIEEVPVALAEIVAALRQDGATVLPCAGLDVAAEALAPERPVLLIADACLPGEALIAELAGGSAPLLATLPDEPALERYERIDADARWAGVALLDGARVREAAAMLGSWDPVSTLLRRAVQEAAPRLDAGAEPPTLLLDRSEVEDAEARIVTGARAVPRSWAERWLTLPLARWAVPPLVVRGTAPEMLTWPGALLALAAGALGIAGARWPALGALLLALPLAAAGAQLARIADEPSRLGRLAAWCEPVGATLAAMGLAARATADTRQWGWLLVGLVLIAGAALTRRLRPLVPAGAGLWLPRYDALAWALVPFALVGRWEIGLAALALYAVAGAGMLLRALLRRVHEDAGLPPPKLF